MENLSINFLEKWIQPQHLTPEAVAQTRAKFEAHPSHIARLSHFLHAEKIEKLSRLVREDVTYRRMRGIFDGSHRQISEEEFAATKDEDRFFQMNQMEKLRLKEGVKPSLDVLFYVKFQEFFYDARFAAFLRALTGLDLVAPSTFLINSLEKGDFIRAHNDVHTQRHMRRLGFILYLSPDWKPEYGGALRVTSHQNNNSMWEVEYNAFAFFDVLGHKEHEVYAVLPAAPIPRVSFNGWFAGPE